MTDDRLKSANTDLVVVRHRNRNRQRQFDRAKKGGLSDQEIRAIERSL